MSSNHESETTFKPFVDALNTQQPTEQQNNHMQARLLESIEAYDGIVAEDDSTNSKKFAPWQWLKGLSSKFQLGLAGSCAAAITLSLALFFSGGTGNPAFAAVVQKLSAITSMYYAGEMRSGGEAIMKLEVYYRSPSQLRIVNTPLANGADSMSVVNVLDTKLGKGLIIFPHADQAMPFEFTPGNDTDNTVEKELLAWHDKILNYKGEVSIGEAEYRKGIEVLSYSIKEENMLITLWVNPTTELPVSIKLEIDNNQGQGNFIYEADIEFNQTYSDELFDISPSNYQLLESDED